MAKPLTAEDVAQLWSDFGHRHSLATIVTTFAGWTPHQRLNAVRTLWVMFELDKQLAKERAAEKGAR